jgi:hypothetical protein
MPFSGPGTYLETIDEYDGHWTDVNLELAPGAMEMPSAYVRGPLMNSIYVGEVPGLPAPTSGQGIWQRKMDDHAHLWNAINTTPPAGFTPPLILPNTTTQAQFAAKVAALKTTFTNIAGADQNVGLKLEERDAIFDRVYAALSQYRATVEGLFGAEHPLSLSCPRLVPLPGHTPDPVALTGFWDVDKEWAEFNWTASGDPDIANYVLRRSGSNPYSGATEQHVETLGPDTLTAFTSEGLLTPGATMRFKIYVVLTTGNERGSNVVEITRPL